MAIEVERRGVVGEAIFQHLPDKLLGLGAKDLGENNAQTMFYLGKDYQLKVQLAESKQTAKVAWKSGTFGSNGGQEEVELQLAADQYANAQALIARLVPDAERVGTAQRRHDYALGDLTISLKHSDDWGYHIEIEQMVETGAEVSAANSALEDLARTLGVILFTKEEEAAFVQKIVGLARANDRVKQN